jgi:DNA polymerase-3 subunit epsilon
MPLELQRPLAFFDLETTGLSITTDRIVEIAILKLKTDGTTQTFSSRVNPGIPIPADVSKIHGIFDEDVRQCPTFKELCPKILQFLDDCDFAGYNSNYFDIPMLMEEFIRADVDFNLKARKMIDVQSIFHQNEPRDLKAAYKFYCNKSLENAHSAEADVFATYEILISQMERYPHIKNDVPSLHKYTARNNRMVDLAGRIVLNDKGIEVFNFGKFKGVSVEEALQKEPGYYNWMINGDFPAYTKKILTSIRLRMLQNNLK